MLLATVIFINRFKYQSRINYYNKLHIKVLYFLKNVKDNISLLINLYKTIQIPKMENKIILSIRENFFNDSAIVSAM